MSKEKPDMEDINLTLKLFELRRETVTRQSRDALNMKFWPKSLADVQAVSSDFQNPLNAPWRQMSTYWEMVYGFARNGIANADFLIENNGEGLFFFAKIQPYLEEYRKVNNLPTAFRNCEWISTQCEEGRKRFEMISNRVKMFSEKMK